MNTIMPEETKRVRHILEYGFTEISGINGTTLDAEQVTGGYAGRSFDVPTVAKATIASELNVKPSTLTASFTFCISPA